MGNNSTGGFNTALGEEALGNNTSSFFNTAIGIQAAASNNGGENTVIGANAFLNNTDGGANTAVGTFALFFQHTGNDNIALGECAGKAITGNNNIDIGNPGDSSDSNTIRIGNPVAFTDPPCQPHIKHTATFISGISEVPVAGAAVFVNSSGQLGVAGSSARFKDEIKPMDRMSEAILALRPVTFRYKKEIDPNSRAQFGLVAEDVEKVNPDLVARDALGKPFAVRYEAVNAMLLNEFLKEHNAFLAEQHNVEKLQATVAQQQKQIEALTAGLQKVSAQLEMSRPAAKVAKSGQ
jgi:hypothetical protein